MAGISGWRANDVVVYDAMRESATALTALLVGAPRRDTMSAQQADEEIRRLRHEVLAVDAYDRAAVSALAVRISQRASELEEPKL